MNTQFQKLVIGLLLMIAMRLTKDNRNDEEQQIINSGMEFLK
jgi:hypothetical protein